jgi:GNAT superfamily N-acetyltransferase
VNDGYRIRLATPRDARWLSIARARMVVDMGGGSEAELLAGAIHFEQWAREGMDSGSYLAWIAEVRGQPVACAGVWLKPRQPDPRTGHDLVPYVLNVYCEPAHRRRGLAAILMDRILAWARTYGFQTIELHASDDGRRLYEGLGFRPTSEMRLQLRAQDPP